MDGVFFVHSVLYLFREQDDQSVDETGDCRRLGRDVVGHDGKDNRVFDLSRRRKNVTAVADDTVHRPALHVDTMPQGVSLALEAGLHTFIAGIIDD